MRLENENHNIVNINDGEKYVVLSVSGLNPPSASIFTNKSPNRKGVKYNGSTLNERNIVLQIKILGDIEANRNELYTWTDTEQYVKVHYKNGLKNVYCEGHITDHDNDFFTSNEIVSLAIICENPYWHDLQEISTEITDILSQFTFPFAIDSAGIPFSTIMSSNATNVFNAGAETGARFIIKCNGTIKDFSIYDAQNSIRRFPIYTTFYDGWLVEINTESSPKTVKAYLPDGTVKNLMRYVGASPTWFSVKKGNNMFGFSATSGSENAEVSVSFTNNYLGV